MPYAPLLLLLIAYVGFISLGLPDAVFGVAWPSVRQTFGLQQSAAAAVFIGTGLTYFISSFFTGRMLQKMGIGAMLALSSLLVALCTAGYGLAGWWWLFAACSVLHGFGSGAIDTGLNHYVAHHFSARHMNWLHACYSLGAMLGPLIMTVVIASNATWRAGYLTVAGVLLLLATLFIATRRKWDAPDPVGDAVESPPKEPVVPLSMRQTLRHPVVKLQIAFYFVYAGLELVLGNWTFTVLTESRGIERETAGLWVTIYYGSICAGRFLLGAVVDRIGIVRLVRWSILAILVAVGLLLAKVPGIGTMLALALAGFGLASIYPCMMTKTPERIGPERASHGIGLQVGGAMLGGAALPSLSGFIGQNWGLEWIPVAAMCMAAALWALHERILVRARGGG